ncbi:hypothetical protein N7541_006144 [Penicillium brevicompactum]|uniref:Uncharacterized protein n=1 Tax=Penicillium brevicompactum TaxID=5074 RepID=A0A9W9R634_PENBR|nr:hypothetical protein N7541_006144 [Penicillium brevicompactum]
MWMLCLLWRTICCTPKWTTDETRFRACGSELNSVASADGSLLSHLRKIEQGLPDTLAGGLIREGRVGESCVTAVEFDERNQTLQVQEPY